MRVKTGPHRRRKHKKALKAAKGMRLAIGKRFKVSKQAQLHADQYAYIGRKLRKRDFRRLWIQRINAGLSQLDEKLNYSTFMNLLKQNKIELNRKMLAELVVNDPTTFKAIVQKVYGK